MHYTKLDWRNAQPYSKRFDDIYFSTNQAGNISGEAEFNHVFLKQNNLPQRWQAYPHHKKDFVIAELGFGSGLNCLLTIREWLKFVETAPTGQCLHYIAIEKYPLSPSAIRQIMQHHPELAMYMDVLLSHYPPAINAQHTRRLFDNKVIIHFNFSDAYAALKHSYHKVDTWFLDGFSPAKNPAMWSADLFLKIVQNSDKNASLSTYTAAGFVKRNMQQAGFRVKKVAGFGKKREMLTACLPAQLPKKQYSYKDKPWFNLPQTHKPRSKNIAIIGAGIAGLSMAYALVQRGYFVTLIDDANKEKANQCSANLAAIIYPRLSINNNIDTEFFITAYAHTVYMLNKLQKQSGEKFWFNFGLLQRNKKSKIDKLLTQYQFNEDFISYKKMDIAENIDCLNLKNAGVVLPEKLLAEIKRGCKGKINIIHSHIDKVKNKNSQWFLYNKDKEIFHSAQLIMANGTNINNLLAGINFPLSNVRGQMVALSQKQKSKMITVPVSADIYITPAINNKHYLGGSYSRENKSIRANENDNLHLINKLNKVFPDIFAKGDIKKTWVGFRNVAVDRVSIVGAVYDNHFFCDTYHDIAKGDVRKHYPSAQHQTGLYISGAHGSRGFTSAFLCAEIIAAQINNEPMLVNKTILDYINPARFIIKKLKSSTQHVANSSNKKA